MENDDTLQKWEGRARRTSNKGKREEQCSLVLGALALSQTVVCKLQLTHSTLVWPWATYLVSLGLRFLLFKFYI